MPTQAIDALSNVNIDIWPAEHYGGHEAFLANHDQSATALSPSLHASVANFPGFGTLQPDSPAQASADDVAHAALSPCQARHVDMNNFEARKTSV
jgi:hypothetical protein